MSIRHLVKRPNGTAIIVPPAWKAIFEHTHGSLKFKIKFIRATPTIQIRYALAPVEKPEPDTEETVSLPWLKVIPQ